jgi:hypothetical protein
MILLAFDLFVTQAYSSSDFLNGISDKYSKKIPKNKKLFLGIICDPNLRMFELFEWRY